MRPSITCFSMAVLVMLSQASSAQQVRDTVELQVAALRYARETIARNRVLAVDTTSVIDFKQGRHARLTDSAIVGALGASARRGASSDLIVCTTPRDYKSCSIANADIVVTLAFPTFRGDSAFFPIRVQARQNARWPISETTQVLRFVKKGGAWVFASAARRSVT